MKFKNPSLFFFNGNMDAHMDGQAQSNMSLNVFKIGGIIMIKSKYRPKLLCLISIYDIPVFSRAAMPGAVAAT